MSSLTRIAWIYFTLYHLYRLSAIFKSISTVRWTITLFSVKLFTLFLCHSRDHLNFRWIIYTINLSFARISTKWTLCAIINIDSYEYMSHTEARIEKSSYRIHVTWRKTPTYLWPHWTAVKCIMQLIFCVFLTYQICRREWTKSHRISIFCPLTMSENDHFH